MKVTEIEWDWESALLVHGESTEEEARAIARDHFGLMPSDEVHVGPIEQFRRWPDGSGAYDMRIEQNRSESIVGTFRARLVQ